MLTVMERMISLNSNHVEHIKELLSVNPQWGRARLSRELCRQWEQTKRAFNSHPAYPIVPHQTELISDGLAELIPLQIAVASQKRKITSCSTACYRNIIIWDTEALSGKASNILSAIPSPARWPAFCLAPRHGKPRRGTSSSDGRAAGAKAICLL